MAGEQTAFRYPYAYAVDWLRYRLEMPIRRTLGRLLGTPEESAVNVM